MWDRIVSVSDHCLSFYFQQFVATKTGLRPQEFITDRSNAVLLL